MVEFLGLLFSLAFLLFLLLPVMSLLRLARLSRTLEELNDRVHSLEREMASARAQSAQPVSSPVIHADPPAFAVEAAGVGSAPAPPDAAFGTAPDAPTSPDALDALDAPDLETRIGGHGLLYTGVLVLLLGVSFFLKYAFDNAWVNETGRVMLGGVAGIALIAGGLRLAARDLRVFGQALVGTGLAILYLAVYSALNFYGVIGPNLAFAGMLLVTLAAAALADHQRSQALAVIAVGGGFLTPFLVGSGENAQLTLFSYDALLVVGTLLLALRHQWLALNALSYALTFMTLTAWAGRHYTADLWLRTLLFLTLFCVLFVIIVRKTARTPGATARLVTAFLATGPLFYHLAAIAITADHPPAAHVYLIAFTVVGLWLTAEPHRPWIRLVVLFGGFAPLLGTVILPDGITWILPNVVTIVAVASLHTMALLDRSVRQREPLATADLLALHLTGLGLFALLYQALQPAYPDLRGGLAAIVALGAIGLWQWLQVRDHVASLNAAALAFTLAALGVAVQFDGPAVVIGWAAEGAAAVWVGVRVSSVPFQYGGLLLWILAVLKLSEGYFDTPARFLPILNARSLSTLFLIALAYGMAWMFDRNRGGQGGRLRTALHVAASFLSLMWITAEIRSYWDTRDQTLQAFLYEQMMLSLAWGAYGAAVILAGMRRRYPVARYIGITVIAVTVLKVFFYDLWELGGIYRVVGFIGFGVLLVLVSYLYQKKRQDTSPPEPPPSPEVG